MRPDQRVEEDIDWKSLCRVRKTGSPEMLSQRVDVQMQQVVAGLDFGGQQRLRVRVGRVINRDISM
jgi:hypothetical protein